MNINSIGWQVKNHGESIMRKDFIDVPFPEKACIEVNFCEAYVDKEAKELADLKKIEAVYS